MTDLNDVKAWGATGDGVTDDTPAFMAAISAPMWDRELEKQVELSLPDPRPSDPLEALSWLGETEEDVVRALRERGIKGEDGSATSCPIARYLGVWWDYLVVFHTVTTHRFDPSLRDLPTPPHVFKFIQNFDQGAYPDLIADD